MAKNEYKVQSISFPDVGLLEAAKAKAKANRWSLSNYICSLMEEDLGWHAGRVAAPTGTALNEKPAMAQDVVSSRPTGPLAGAYIAPEVRNRRTPRKTGGG